MGREVRAWIVLMGIALCACMCVFVAVTHQASWEAAAQLMDAKEVQREEGGSEGDKCLYCSNAGAARERDVNEMKREEKNEMLTGKQGSTQMSDACLESVFATLTSLCWFSFWERFCTVSLFCWSIHLTLWLWQYHTQPNLAETTSPGKANTPCWASHVSSLPCPLNKQLSLWRLHGREGDLSGLLTGSLSGLLFHPVVNTALLGRPMAGVFTSRQRK